MITIFDVAVIGGGPGGYVAALRAAQNGLSVVCIDDGVNAQGEPSPGGTCLNVGCIPSKSLLQSSELYAQVQHEASIHGVNVEGVSFNAAAMIQRKDAIVSRLTMGISLLFKKNKVKHLCGLATLECAQDEIWQLRVNDQHLHARNVVIATGSQPRQLPGVTIDNQQILDNRGALALSEVPPRLGVIGAGVIGLELGSVWNRVGSDVTLLEMAPMFLPALEARLSNEVRKAMIASGMKMQLAVEIEAIEQRDDGVHVRWRQGEKQEESHFDKLILAIGRVPRLSGVDLVQLGLEADNRGGIAVDNLCRTGKAGLWAIGDDWLLAGAPWSLTMSVILYFLARKLLPPETEAVEGGSDAIKKALAELGPTTGKEKRLIGISLLLLLFWSTGGKLHSIDTTSVTLAGLAIMLLPGIGVMSWKEVEKRVQWGTLLMFGIGISLGSTLLDTQAASWMANYVVKGFGLDGLPSLAIFAILAAFLIIIHLGFASATALTAALLPILISLLSSLPPELGVNPVGMTILLAFSVSFGFILPINAPQNMVCMGTDTFTPRQFTRVGLYLTVIGYLLLLLFAATWWKILGLM